MKTVVVSGATGLIGGRVARALVADGVAVRVLARNEARARDAVPGTAVFAWDAASGAPPPAAAIEGADAIVSLAGESIGAGRWTAARRQALRGSRIDGTRAMVEAIAAARSKGGGPAVLVSGSAIGIYGDRGDEKVDEESASGAGFLADLCRAWEEEARKAEAAGVRVVLVRTGLVVAPRGGFLDRLLPLFKIGAGGRLGGGSQWWSWIHVDDEIGLVRHALAAESVGGPINATAPTPVTNRDFTAVLARVLHRPAIAPAPAFALELALGRERAHELLLGGQRVEPKKALSTGYRFAFTDLDAALADVNGKR